MTLQAPDGRPMYPPIPMVHGTPTSTLMYGVPVPTGQYGQHGGSPHGFYTPSNAAGSKFVTFNIEQHMPSSKVKKPSLNDVVSASMGLLNSMIERNHDCKKYGLHVKFLTDKRGVYNESALIEYDVAMRERGEAFGEKTFCYFDHEIFSRLVGLENLDVGYLRSLLGIHAPVSQGATASVGPKKKKKEKPKKEKLWYCYGYNSEEGCATTGCIHPHVCKSCQGQHPKQKCPANKPSK